MDGKIVEVYKLIIPFVTKYIGAAIAFAGAAIGAGIGIGQAGSAGLAAAAENESMKTQGLIITALAEAVAIYGIVVALLILGS